jgi:hypothetical protein
MKLESTRLPNIWNCPVEPSSQQMGHLQCLTRLKDGGVVPTSIYIYLYILVGTRDLWTLRSPPKVSWGEGGGGRAKKDKIIKYIWLVLSV